MNSNLQSIIEKLEKGNKLGLGNNENFSKEILLDESLQCSILGKMNFLNVTFKNIDFPGSFFPRLFLKITDSAM